MWHTAHPQTSTHPTHAKNLAIHTNARINDQLAGESCVHHSSLITRHCLIQSLVFVVFFAIPALFLTMRRASSSCLP